MGTDTGNEALRAAFEEWCIRFELNSSSVYVRDQWQAAYARGAADARARIREAIIADQATGAGDYTLAEEYADKVCGAKR